MAKDSFQVRDLLSETHVNSSCRIVKTDLKDFYLSGEPVDISQTVSKLVESWSPSPRKAMVNSGSDPTRKPFVLRYHPLLPRVLQRALTSTPIPVECGLRIMPAWQNALPSLGSIIAKCNRDKVKRREGWRVGFLCVSNTPDRSLRSVYGLTSLCTQ